ncbi:MAG: bifunctional adenosylcobinamide kinase/adenosylcobinamide-phosphate guanylyltransferase [Verrucomicrobiota bacterium]
MRPDNADTRLILVGGGARSGKSRFAVDLARAIGARRIFIATAEPLDDEMTRRISRHRAERGRDFVTVEEPVDLAGALDNAGGVADADVDVILVDCMTLWVSNLLVRGGAEADLGAAFDGLGAALARRRVPVILVTNEVGFGLVPETPLGRAFRDAIGTLHQRLASRADEIHAAIMGVVMRLHPPPVVVVRPPADEIETETPT